jgi:hypothetical protein
MHPQRHVAALFLQQQRTVSQPHLWISVVHAILLLVLLLLPVLLLVLPAILRVPLLLLLLLCCCCWSAAWHLPLFYVHIYIIASWWGRRWRL